MKYSAVPQPAPDISLTARLEAAHEWAVENYVSCLQLRRPKVGAARISVSDGSAFYAGPSPFSFAVGIGLSGAVTAAELDRIEQFYAAHGVSTKVDITPATHPSLAELVKTRGYRIADVTSVLMLDLQASQIGPSKAAVELRWAKACDCDLWVDTLARHFFAAEPGAERRRNMECMFHASHALNVIATVNGHLAGVSGCMIPHSGGMGVIYGSCTLPDFRRLGVHREMLRLRAQTARVAGCEVLMATALPGSDSERNLERFGFEVSYLKTGWTNA